MLVLSCRGSNLNRVVLPLSNVFKNADRMAPERAKCTLFVQTFLPKTEDHYCKVSYIRGIL